MSNEAAVATFQLELPVPRPGLWRRFIPAGENLLVSLALGAMMVIPLAEIILRRTLHTGIQGATPIVEHLTLIVGMLGGAIAARDNRLLSLSNIGGRLQGRFQVAGRIVAMAVAAAVTASLAIAATQFVVEEKGAGAVLAYGMPIWVVEMCLPVGFGLITAYLVWHAGELARASGGICARGGRDLVCRSFAHFAWATRVAVLVRVARRNPSWNSGVCDARRHRADSLLGNRPTHRLDHH